ncbi:hypothetical protein [Novosphingobium sediminicola]|uniref:Uncharacterized protein n=1 Tax=Novosphingobium sediminicola TaxID=563162 RepID=A0A7W6CIL0_9SPHN|nr:hypothetical protein [Novosphingobium sediminicola]MBB3957149.1 hypothetical protein [Novosphingobium sediminicola]
MAKSLIAARSPAARYLHAQSYGADADYVETGQSDDTREVQIALAMHKILYVAPTPPTKYKGRRLVGEEC